MEIWSIGASRDTAKAEESHSTRPLICVLAGRAIERGSTSCAQRILASQRVHITASLSGMRLYLVFHGAGKLAWTREKSIFLAGRAGSLSYGSA